MTAAQALKLQARISGILKRRFPNLTVEETTELSGTIVLVVEQQQMEERSSV